MSSIQDYIRTIRIIDGHEHLSPPSIRQKEKADFFSLFHYLDSDFVTAGMKRGTFHPGTSLTNEEKARLFLTYWNRTKNTVYAKSFQLAINELYGESTWTEQGILELNEKVLAATADDGWYDHVLDQAGIDVAITLVQSTKLNFARFKPVMFLDFYFKLRTLKDVEAVEQSSGVRIHSLRDYIDALNVLMDRYKADGMVATKLGHAYWRTLRVEKPTYADAERIFNRLSRLYLEESITQQESAILQDFLIHEVIRASIARKLPIQIHTGHHETSVSNNGNIITNSQVTDLIPLFLDYPDAQFVLLHGGFPYMFPYLSVVKNFANVYADMTWMYIISPTASKQFLHQLIEMVPQTKIFGFGGDYNQIEGTYAHAKMARQAIGEVLEEKVLAGYMTEDEAQEFARRILRDNLLEFYQL